MKQERLVLVNDRVPRLHSGGCWAAQRDEEDTNDPARVTCPECLARLANAAARTPTR
jgi:hypothetical protein